MASWKKVLTHDSAVDATTGLQLVAVDSTNDAIVRLSDGTNTDDVKFVAGSGITVAHDSAAQITLSTSSTILDEEAVEDIVGGMLGGTNTGITITYQDSTNDIDFVVADQSLNTTTNGGGTNMTLTMSNPTTADTSVISLAGGLAVTAASGGNVTLSAAGVLAESDFEEAVEDIVGGMLGGTNTGITITYQDSTNDIDFVVSDQTLTAASTGGTNLKLSMSNPSGTPDDITLTLAGGLSVSSVTAGAATLTSTDVGEANPTVADSNHATSFLLFNEDATGTLGPKTDTDLKYDANTQTLEVKNLTVDGTTTTVDTTNLEVKDQFILLNNASVAADADAGIVVEGSTKNVAFGYDQSADRFVFDKTGATSGMTSIGSDAFFVHVHSDTAVPTDGTNGADTDFAQVGNLYTISGSGTGAGDIYIYS